MPSPILHAYAGYSIYKYSLKEGDPKSWKAAGLFAVIANLPDLDMLPGSFFGNAEMFHRGFTHSIAGSVICSFAIAAIAKYWKKIPFTRMFWLSMAAYFSHVFLDAFTGSIKFVLWPFKISFEPLPLAVILSHAQHPVIPCDSLNQLCSFLISSTFTVRLAAEVALVFVLSRISRLFPKYRVLHSSIAESPAFITGLALFLFVLTALMMTEVAG